MGSYSVPVVIGVDCEKYDDPAMIIEWTKEEINRILKDHEDEIIQGAIDKLVDKLARTKVVKDATAEAVKKVR